MIEAFVFDFDGLIIDTEWCEYRSICDQFERYGLTYDIAHFQQFVGSAWPTGWVAELQSGCSVTLDADELIATRRARRDELLADHGLLPGVVELLDLAAANGIALAVASSSSRDWVEPHLDRLGLLERFAAVFTRNDVAQAKPAPDLYTAAHSALGARPGATIAFEDSFNGCTAAKAAGLRCVVVPNRVTRVQDFSAADLVTHSLAALTHAQLSALVGER